MPASAVTAPRREHGTTRVDGEERRPNIIGILVWGELVRCSADDKPRGCDVVAAPADSQLVTLGVRSASRRKKNQFFTRRHEVGGKS